MAKKQSNESTDLASPSCSTNCSRPYTHQKVTGACLACKKAHHACDQERPKCARCVRLGSECEYRLHKKPGRKRLHAQSDSSAASSSSTSSFPQKRRRYYSESNGTNSDSSNDQTPGKTTRTSRNSTPPTTSKKRYGRGRRLDEGFSSNDEQDETSGTRPPSAPELLVTMLRTQQQQHSLAQQQQQQLQQQQSYNMYHTTKYQQQQPGYANSQQPQLLNALLMCLGNKERTQEEIQRQQIDDGRRQLGYILNRNDGDLSDLTKGKESEGSPREGFPDERVGLDERFPGPTLEGEGMLYPPTGPLQNGLESTVGYIPKYNPRTTALPNPRQKVDTKFFPQQAPLPLFQPTIPNQIQQQQQQPTNPTHQHSTNCMPTNTNNPFYILPPPKGLSPTPPPSSPAIPTYLNPLSPFPDSPPNQTPASNAGRGDVEPLPSLSKLLNFCSTAKTR